MRTVFIAVIFMFTTVTLFAQTDRKEVRAGNRKFGSGEYAEAEIDYKKALLKDTLSCAAAYNLGNTYYKMENFQEADRYYAAAKDSLAATEYGADSFFNMGDSYLKQRRYAEAVDAFKNALRKNPGDMDAKSNLAYAQKMLENQQNQQNQQDQNNDQNQQNQDQNQNQNDNQDQNKDNDQNQKNNDDNQDQNQDQNQDKNQKNNDNGQDDKRNAPQPKISQQSAQQMLQAIQDKEKETQDKVNKEKALMLKSKQKEKNW